MMAPDAKIHSMKSLRDRRKKRCQSMISVFTAKKWKKGKRRSPIFITSPISKTLKPTKNQSQGLTLISMTMK